MTQEAHHPAVNTTALFWWLLVLTVAEVAVAQAPLARLAIGVLLVGMALITVFWGYESRRFRFTDIWYSRLRKIEENFYGPILRRDLVSPESSWGRLIAEDLFNPTYKLPRLFALRQRFTRNYWPIYAVLLGAWVVHVLAFPEEAGSWSDVKEHLRSGLLPWWAPISYVATILVGMGALVMLGPRPPHLESEGGLERPEDDRDPILDV